ncbi:MAG: L-threonylcarbamoyladenylate synthase [Nanoarchaeota archaeon]|nr:L-threonylcarbamoyladenylate synthase [Nanoarchaeota archaeon]
MEVINVDEAQMRAPHLMKIIDEGALFIYPTDTIYGIGCDATKQDAVDHVRKLKNRPKMPLSIIVPSKKWIIENCEVTDEAIKYIEELPGPVTLILKLKNKNAVAKNVIPGLDAIGVRMPKHWITEFVSVYGNPIITTSANITGQEFMTDLDNLDVNLQKGMTFCLFEGEKKGTPSNIIHLEGDKVKVRER